MADALNPAGSSLLQTWRALHHFQPVLPVLGCESFSSPGWPTPLLSLLSLLVILCKLGVNRTHLFVCQSGLASDLEMLLFSSMVVMVLTIRFLSSWKISLRQAQIFRLELLSKRWKSVWAYATPGNEVWLLTALVRPSCQRIFLACLRPVSNVLLLHISGLGSGESLEHRSEGTGTMKRIPRAMGGLQPQLSHENSRLSRTAKKKSTNWGPRAFSFKIPLCCFLTHHYNHISSAYYLSSPYLLFTNRALPHHPFIKTTTQPCQDGPKPRTKGRHATTKAQGEAPHARAKRRLLPRRKFSTKLCWLFRRRMDRNGNTRIH